MKERDSNKDIESDSKASNSLTDTGIDDLIYQTTMKMNTKGNDGCVVQLDDKADFIPNDTLAGNVIGVMVAQAEIENKTREFKSVTRRGDTKTSDAETDDGYNSIPFNASTAGDIAASTEQATSKKYNAREVETSVHYKLMKKGVGNKEAYSDFMFFNPLASKDIGVLEAEVKTKEIETFANNIGVSGVELENSSDSNISDQLAHGEASALEAWPTIMSSLSREEEVKTKDTDMKHLGINLKETMVVGDINIDGQSGISYFYPVEATNMHEIERKI